jgi:hypothetical protein
MLYIVSDVTSQLYIIRHNKALEYQVDNCLIKCSMTLSLSGHTVYIVMFGDFELIQFGLEISMNADTN